jgi:tRNA (guanine37-N1)-methyltransferase
MVPGVLTNEESGSTESLEGNLLEYPQYSRPEEWQGKKVPAILLSGDHAKVDAWRRQQSLLRTAARRPDLLSGASLSEEERELVKKTLANPDII